MMNDRQVKYFEYDFDAEDALEKGNKANYFLTVCDQNNVPLIKKCLNDGIDPNTQRQNETALHRTCKNGYLEATQVLLNTSQIKINSKDYFGGTALILAADRNKFDICRELVSAGADVHLANKFGDTALHRAVHWRSFTTIELLLSFKANPNTENMFVQTPLYIAAVDSTCIESVALLIKYGADVNMNRMQIMPVLLEEDALVENNLELTFLNACDLDNFELMTQCLKNGVNPNANIRFLCALHRTTKNGSLLSTQLLLSQRNIDVNFKNNFGSTSLNIAADTNKIDICRVLLNAGANVKLADKHGYTALHCAVHWRYVNVVELLLSFKANPNIENIFSKTPLSMAAVDTFCKENVSLLIKNGADVNRNIAKVMPVLLECALCCTTRKQLDIIEFLLDNGADINIQAIRTNRTVLHIVALTGYVPLAILLIKRGVNTQLIDRFKLRAIDVAKKNKNQTIIDLLSERPP